MIDAFALAALDGAVSACFHWPISSLKAFFLVTKAQPLQLPSGVHGSASYFFGRLSCVLCRSFARFAGVGSVMPTTQAYAQEGQIQGGPERC